MRPDCLAAPDGVPELGAELGPAEDRGGLTSRRITWVQRLVVVAAPALLTAVFVRQWSHGWLLLLDSSPGPRSAPWAGPDLPVGPALRTLVGAVTAVDAQLTGWVVPSAAIVASYAGGYRLARRWPTQVGRRLSPVAAVVAGCVAAANPFVAARLYAGQIGVLWGYAALWWLLAALTRALEHRARRAWIAPGAWLALAGAATVHLAVIGIVPLVAAGVVHARRHGGREATLRVGVAVVVAATATAAWLVPALVGASSSLGEAGGERATAAFASGGSLTTLWARALGGGAFWRPLPAGALTAFGLVVAAAWLAAAVAWRRDGGHSRDLRHVLAAGAVVAVVAVHLAHGPWASAWSWAVTNLWPAGLMREPGKVLMLAIPTAACGAALAAQRVLDRHRRVGSATVAAVVVVCVASWVGLVTRLEPSAYPSEWVAARAVADADRCDIAVLGDGAYTDPGFTGSRVVADATRGFLGPRAVVSNDARMADLRPRAPRTAAEQWAQSVNRRYLTGAGPSPRAAAASAAGIGWIFVDRAADRPAIAVDLTAGGFSPAFRSARVDLWRVPGGCA